ncbi:MucR family transcriptional regulator [Roseomonas sp. HJA6]|uniref:MucR family transcriptional regulator n=1 Tax=Roseomonas alba TaxID=2846776 RepID=A0ABS7AC37_9PROT|nr:MucR family transcriptional regulator [Neoroseomonas alba]MBW6399869.1 MucR family transcriptional regulator [Neoroseomonas alba]
MSEVTARPAMLQLTASIVAAHVSNNPVPAGDLPSLISGVYAALSGIEQAAKEPAAVKQEPAVAIRKSVQRDYLICLEDGRKLKMLKRHLATAYGMTPDQYREKWGLPADYPMVAPAYAERRSTLAKEIGLGTGEAGRAKKRRS